MSAVWPTGLGCVRSSVTFANHCKIVFQNDDDNGSCNSLRTFSLQRNWGLIISDFQSRKENIMPLLWTSSFKNRQYHLCGMKVGGGSEMFPHDTFEENGWEGPG